MAKRQVKRHADWPRQVEEDLDRILRQLGAQTDTVPIAILRAWPSVVGEHAATKTQPVRFVRGVLTVHTTSEVWVTELLADSAALLQRLARAVVRPTVRGLRVRVGDVLPPRAESSASDPTLEVEPGPVPPEIEKALATVEDPDLRDSIRRVVGLSLRRGSR